MLRWQAPPAQAPPEYENPYEEQYGEAPRYDNFDVNPPHRAAEVNPAEQQDTSSDAVSVLSAVATARRPIVRIAPSAMVVAM